MVLLLGSARWVSGLRGLVLSFACAGFACGGSGSQSPAQTTTDAGTDAPNGETGATVDAGIGAVGVLGQRCSPPGALACAGNMQRLQLLCGASGQWVANGTCSGSMLCDSEPGTSAGTCQEPLPECAGMPGAETCDSTGTAIETCGPDTVSATTMPCPMAMPICNGSPAQCVVCLDLQGHCDGQQPQVCMNGVWQNSGPPCNGANQYCWVSTPKMMCAAPVCCE
jgi:hypothetical protein